MRHKHLGAALVATSALLWPALGHARDYLADAAAALKKGDLRAAQIQLRNAVRDDPQSAEAHYQLARVSLQLGDPIAAEREATAARDHGYDPRKVIPLLTQTYLSQGKSRELLNDFTVSNKDPVADAQILVGRGYALIANGDVEAAKKAFVDAEKLSPDALEPLTAQFKLAFAKGDVPAAQATVDRGLALQPNNPEVLLEKALLLHRKNDLAGALAVTNDIIAQAPGSLEARLERATLQIALNQDAKAAEDVAAVQAALPNNPRSLLLQTILQARKKDWAAADATLQKLTPAMNSLPRSYLLLAYVKAQRREWEQAESAAEHYVALLPGDLAGIKLLASIAMERQRPDKVIEVLAKPAAAGVADAATFDMLGRAYTSLGEPDQASQAFQKAAALAPEDAQYRGHLAASRLAAGDPKAAADDLEKALEIAPKQPSVGAALFFAELATGDLNRATDAITKIRQVQGDTPVVQNLDGMLKLAKLDIAGARAEFDGIVAANPDFAPAKLNQARIAAMEGHPDTALQILGAIIEKAPASEPALGMYVNGSVAVGKNADAVAALERARAAAPADTRLTIGLADLYTRTGDAKKALALLAQDPNKLETDPGLLGAQGRAQVALGNLDSARNTYQKVLAIDPRSRAARGRLVGLLVETKNYEAARNLVQEGLRLFPEDIALLQQLVGIDLKENGIEHAAATADRLRGQVAPTPVVQALKGDTYMAAQRYDAAAAEFAAQYQKAPSAVLALRLAGAQMAGGKTDDAAKTLGDWQAKHPNDLAVTQTLANLQLASGKLDQAAKNLQSVLDQKPTDPVALNNLAWILQKRGDARAKDLAQKAYVLMPDGQTADTLGWILVSQGAAQTALPLLRQANAQLANNPDVKYHLAAALNGTGQREEARKLLTGLMASDTKFDEKPNAKKLLDELSKG